MCILYSKLYYNIVFYSIPNTRTHEVMCINDTAYTIPTRIPMRRQTRIIEMRFDVHNVHICVFTRIHNI